MVIQGLIRPPPEIRAVVDHTAQFVAKKGKQIETLIKSKPEGKTPKFAFLDSSSPFHAYYEDRIVFYMNGGEDTKEDITEKTKTADESKDQTDKTVQTRSEDPSSQVKGSAIDPIASALLRQRNKISEHWAKQKNVAAETEATGENGDQKPEARAVGPPKPEQLQFLEIVAPVSLSIAQIETIQAVAQFVALCENHNLLDHLIRVEWNNPAFGFLQPRHAHFAYFSALVDAYQHLRKTWNNDNSSTKRLKSVEQCLESVAYRAEYQRDLASRQKPKEDTGVRVDWHDFVVVETIDFPVNEKVSEPPPPPPPPPPVEQDEVMVGDTGEEIRVVPTYQPKVATQATVMDTMIDPVSGQRVKLSDMPEHMRIQLMDPKWAEERKRFQEKQKDSNLVTDIAGNLERFAQGRGDRFGKKEPTLLSTETDPSKRQEQEMRDQRDQAFQQPVGPALPGQEPLAKKPRLELPPPVPPPVAPEDPFAAAATGTWIGTETAKSDLLPEAEFVQQQGGQSEITVFVRIPNDPSQRAHNFLGQTVSVSIGIQETTKSLKTLLAEKHLNGLLKLQLKKISTGTFLKDSQTLAALNVADQTMLELVPRVRGRK